MSDLDHADIDQVAHLAVLELKPGDVLVLTYPEEITVVQAQRLRDQLKAVLPDHEAVVLSGGVEMGALRLP